MSVDYRFLIGFACSMSLGWPIGKLVGHLRKTRVVASPNEALAAQWSVLTKDPNNSGGMWLGILERVLFFTAAWTGAHEMIAGWLAFKVASKWQAWSSIISVPDTLKAVDDDAAYLVARYQWGSQRLMSFLVGTLANVLAGFAGALLARWL